MNPDTCICAIPERFKSLLRNTSEMLGAHLRLRLPGLSAPFALPVPSVCIQCSKTTPELFHGCQDRQGDGIAGAIDTPALQQWICPNHCEVVTLPVMVPGDSCGMLVAVRPPRNGESLFGRDDHEMLRFLNSLSRLLSEHLTLTSELSSLSSELTNRSEELNLLHAISGRLTEQEDMRQAVREILRQGRTTMGADAAIHSVEPRKLFELALGPTMEERLRCRSRLATWPMARSSTRTMPKWLPGRCSMDLGQLQWGSADHATCDCARPKRKEQIE